MIPEKVLWGALPDGTPVHCVTIASKPDETLEQSKSPGLSLTVSDFGGIVTDLLVGGRDGQLESVVLGYDTAEEYAEDDCFFGATIGRYANRIGGGAFTLDGQTYQLTTNEGENTLHGGGGFHKKLWRMGMLDDAVRLSRRSPDGEDGFPGNLEVAVSFAVSGGNCVTIDYEVITDRDTVCCMTNHSYFNLAGSGTIMDHLVRITANRYTPVGDDLLPTGKMLPVDDRYDFRELRPITRGDYDINYILSSKDACAVAVDPVSGRRLTVSTTLPGLQFYTGGNLSPRKGRNGAEYGENSGLCFEPQFYPNSPNIPKFPTTVLRANETYRQRIQWKFDLTD